jgi:hypothetical protein
MDYTVFISHSGEDTWVARQLSSCFEEVSAKTFLDESNIAIGAKFEDEILEALRKADELVVLITPWALGRPYVWLEIGAAWFKNIPIIILLLGVTPAEFTQKANIPVDLKERNLISLNDVDRYIKELSERVAQKASK